jgi:hypothetical protein
VTSIVHKKYMVVFSSRRVIGLVISLLHEMIMSGESPLEGSVKGVPPDGEGTGMVASGAR